LIVFFNQVQLLFDRRVVLVLVLPDLEKNLNHVLDSLINVLLIQNSPKPIEYHNRYRHIHLLQMVSNLSCKANRNLDAVIRGFVEK